MSVTLIAVLALMLFFTVLAIGVPIGIAMGGVGLLGIIALRGFDAALMSLYTIPYTSVASWSLSVIPHVSFHGVHRFLRRIYQRCLYSRL